MAPARVRTILTLHNLAHQGTGSKDVLIDLGLDAGLLDDHLFGQFGQVNLLKGGIACADAVATVSPTHAREIVSPEGGFGLHHFLQRVEPVGILNGLDVDEWDPTKQPALPFSFDWLPDGRMLLVHAGDNDLKVRSPDGSFKRFTDLSHLSDRGCNEIVVHPDGHIWDLDTYRSVLSIPACIGAKHSSLERQPEWDRLRLRDEVRPEFLVLTGNDLAIDMVRWGSDYLLGLSTFAPDLFALRDQYWASDDSRFYELNDQLQYLGFFSFRSPSPGYKHSAAQFLKLRGWTKTNRTHPKSVARPDSDIEVLRELAQRLRCL